MLLKGITWDHPRGFEPLVASSALYEKTFGLSISWQKRSLANFGDQSIEDLSKQFDLLIIDHPHVGSFWKSGCLVPVDELLPKNLLDKLKSQSAGPSFLSYQYKGKQWALPVDAAMQAAAIRPDLMGNLTVPGSWNEVFESSAMLKKKNLSMGMALCPTDCLCSFLTITAQLGSPIREGNSFLVDKEIGIRSMMFMKRLRDASHEKSLDWNPIQLYDHMATEDQIAYSPLGFCYTNYSREGFRKNKLVFYNAPMIENAVLGGAGIAVSSSSKNPGEAAAFAAWVCSAEIQETIYLTSQGQPGNKLVWSGTRGNSLTSNFFSNTFDTLKHAYMRPRYTGWPPFQQEIGEVLHDYLKNDRQPEMILQHLETEYQASYKN